MGINLLGKSLATNGRRLEVKKMVWGSYNGSETKEETLKSASSLIIGKQELPETILWTPI